MSKGSVSTGAYLSSADIRYARAFCPRVCLRVTCVDVS